MHAVGMMGHRRFEYTIEAGLEAAATNYQRLCTNAMDKSEDRGRESYCCFVAHSESAVGLNLSQA